MTVEMFLTYVALVAHMVAIVVVFRSVLRAPGVLANGMALTALSVSFSAFAIHAMTLHSDHPAWSTALGTFIVLLPLSWALYLYTALQQSVQAELKDSQTTLFQFFDTVPIGIVVFERVGEMMFINRAAKLLLEVDEIADYSRDEYFKRKPFYYGDTDQLMRPDDYASTRALAGESVTIAEISTIRNGERRFFESWGEPVFARDGSVRYGLIAFRDITERRQHDAAIKASEERYRALVENSPAGIWHVAADGSTLFVNETVAKMLELDDPAEIVGAPYTRFMTPESVRRVEQEHALRVQGVSSTYEVEMVGKHGGRSTALLCGAPLFDENGVLQSTIAQFIDTTVLKKAQEDLEDSNQRFRIATQLATDFIYEYDIATGTVRWFGQYDDEDAIENDYFPHTQAQWRERVHPDDLVKFDARYAPYDPKDGAAIVEYRVAMDGQPPACWSERAMLLRNPDGSPRKWIGVVGDVTERRTREQEQQRLEAELSHAQKMESIGRLAGGIAHDFNNILVVVLGYCEMLKQAIPEDEPAYQDVAEIERAGKQASALTAQLLAFSRKQLIAPRQIQLDAAVRSMENMLQRLIGEHISLECILAEDTGAVLADPGQIEQLIVNMAVNARDAMPDGGNLTFETSNIVVTDQYAAEHVDIKPGRYVMLTVSDNGVGMDAETANRVFEPFFTTKEKGKGTGLGLSMVYGIVKQAGGDIHVYSEEGHGTNFRIFFPMIAREGVRDVDDPAAEDVGPMGAGETILVAEDADGPRALVKRILDAEGYHVLATNGPGEALELLQSYPGVIDLLLTDVVMPVMSGPELATKACLLRNDIKVVYMTGYTDNAVIRQGVLQAGVPLLQKPFAARALSAKIRACLDQPPAVNRPTPD